MIKPELLKEIESSIQVLFLTHLITYGELEKIKIRLNKKLGDTK